MASRKRGIKDYTPVCFKSTPASKNQRCSADDEDSDGSQITATPPSPPHASLTPMTPPRRSRSRSRSPSAPLRRSPRLQKDGSKPSRKKKKRKVQFSGRAETVFFELCSPSVHHSRPRTPLSSPLCHSMKLSFQPEQEGQTTPKKRKINLDGIPPFDIPDTPTGEIPGKPKTEANDEHKHTAASLSHIAANNVERQFEVDGIQGVRKALKFYLSTKIQNTKLDLEQQGARIFTSEELEKQVNITKDVGARTLIDKEQIDHLESMTKPVLVEKLSNYYIRSSLIPLKKADLIILLQEKYEEDMKEVRAMIQQVVIRELLCRKLSLVGQFPDRIKRLRDKLHEEQKLFAEEEKTFDDLVQEIESETSEKFLTAKLCEEKAQTFRKELGLYGLDYPDVEVEVGEMGTEQEEESQSSSQAFVVFDGPLGQRAKRLGFRLELYKVLRDQSKLKASELIPSKLSLQQLEHEMQERRMELPFGFLESHSEDEVWQERVNRLNCAVMEEVKKGPMKYDFGSSSFHPSDLHELTDENLILELEKTGIGRSSLFGLDHSVLVNKLANILVTRSNTMLKETIEEELERIRHDHPELAFFLDMEFDPDETLGTKRTESSPVLTLFVQLEKCSLKLLQL